ncbi:sulfatase [Spirochaetia bacterium]|nr:sulfatase [Spirochaetia bacterium]
MKPNIVIVMTDQQRADLRKSRAYALDTMPFLDSWAQGGADFACAYTPNPTCMPARVSMFTGRYPESHKARTNHNALDTRYTTDMLEFLRNAGYATALCGKNHSHHKPEDFDFAETSGHLGHEGNRNLSGAEEEFASFLDKTDHFEAHVPSPGGVEAQHPYVNVSSAFSFLDSRPKEKPFFLWLSFAEPHNPFQVPAPYFDMFPPESLPALHAGPEALAQKGHKFTWLRGVWERVLGKDIENRINRSRSNYHGMLRLIDDQFKRFIEGLESRGLSENTLVLFISDHGDFVGEYGLLRKGTDLPEILTHVPFIWRGPGIKSQGTVNKGFVNLVDIFPTICDILGAEIPFGVQGKSIRPLLENIGIPEKEYDTAYSESGFSGLYWDEKDSLDLVEEGASRAYAEDGRPVTFDCLDSWTQCGQVRMLRKGRYKIQMDMLGKGYLYDIEADPFELKNLFDNPEHLPEKVDMLAELTAAILRACDPIPAPRNRYHFKAHPKGFWFQDYHQ